MKHWLSIAFAIGCGPAAPPDDTDFFVNWDPDTGTDPVETDIDVEPGVPEVTWSGVVHVHSDLLLDGQVCLTILPGTVVRVAPGATLEMSACVLAHGTADDPIVFEPSTGRWAGLVVDAEPGAAVSHVEIRGARIGLTLKSGSVDHLSVSDCETGVLGLAGDGELVHVRAEDVDVGIVSTGNTAASGVVVRRAREAFSAPGILTVDGGLVAQSAAVLGDAGGRTAMTGLALVDNDRIASLTSGSVALSNCVVHHNGDAPALELDGGTTVSVGPMAWLGTGPAISSAARLDATGGFWGSTSAADRVGGEVLTRPDAEVPPPDAPPLPPEDVVRDGTAIRWSPSPSTQVTGYRVHWGPQLDPLEPTGTLIEVGQVTEVDVPGSVGHDVVVVAIANSSASVIDGSASVSARP